MRNSSTQIPLGTPLNRSHSLCNRLQGFWLLNEGGGQIAQDQIIPSISNGALINGAVYKQDIKGNCVSMDGVNDFITGIGLVSTYAFVQNTMVFSMSLWAKLNNTTARQVLFANTISGAESGFFLMFETVGVGFGTKALRFEPVRVGILVNTQSPDNSIVDTNWHHIVVTGSGLGNTILFYIDGVNKATTYNQSYVARGTGDSTSTLKIGAPNLTPTLPLAGKINNVMIWSRTLSQTEVWQLYINPYQMFQSARPLKIAV